MMVIDMLKRDDVKLLLLKHIAQRKVSLRSSFRGKYLFGSNSCNYLAVRKPKTPLPHHSLFQETVNVHLFSKKCGIIERMPGIMDSAPSTSQGFGSPTLVTSDHHHDQHAYQTPLRRRVGEHGKINRNDESRFTLPTSQYDHSKTVKASNDIISSACLQSVISTLLTDVQVTDDSDTVCEYEQLYINSFPSIDLPCPSENCSFAKNVKGSLDSSSDNPALYNESKVSYDNFSLREDQLCSKNTGSLTENCEASGYVCSHFEDFKETKPFCSLTEEFKVSKESLLRKRDEELHGPTDSDSFSEDNEEFGYFCPLLDKEQKSKDVHYRSPAPEGLQESNYLESFCEDEKKDTKNSPWIIQRSRHLSFCKWGKQRLKHVHEEVGQKSKRLHKSNEDENVTASIPYTSESTHQPMPPPFVGRKDSIQFGSSGANVLVHNTLSLIHVMSTWLGAIAKTYLLLVILLTIISQTTSEVSDVPLDCTSKMHLTSPNYPSNYPSDANMKWQVTAPSGRWILVKFNDFNVEEQFDFLDLVDIDNIRNTVRYTGERTRIPSFLTQGSALDATFASFGHLERRGFNITVSCYETSNTSGGRLEGGNTPAEGFLQILSQLGQRVSVCEDNLSATVAEVICGELGYPGVKEISYKTDGCQSDVNDQTCVRAPSCQDNTYLLEDCSFTTGNCTTFSSVNIKCYEPGFKGCYGFDIHELQNVSTQDSASKCISSCRGKASHDIAVFDGEKCFCSSASEVNLLYKKPAQNQPTCPSPVKNNLQIVNALVYNVSVGFCNQTDDVINGTWDSNNTWFGSIVHVTCDDGYSLNGNEALQCLPGVSSYYPVWNDSMPTCDRFDGRPGEDPPRGIPTPYIILICIIVAIFIIIFIIVIIVLVIEKKTNRYELRARTYRRREVHRISVEERGQLLYSGRGHRGNRGNGTALILFCTQNQQIRTSEPSESDVTFFPSLLVSAQMLGCCYKLNI